MVHGKWRSSNIFMIRQKPTREPYSKRDSALQRNGDTMLCSERERPLKTRHAPACNACTHGTWACAWYVQMARGHWHGHGHGHAHVDGFLSECAHTRVACTYDAPHVAHASSKRACAICEHHLADVITLPAAEDAGHGHNKNQRPNDQAGEGKGLLPLNEGRSPLSSQVKSSQVNLNQVIAAVRGQATQGSGSETSEVKSTKMKRL